MRIALVIVAFDSRERLERHLGFLRNQARPPDTVIIVNTGKSPVDWAEDESGGRFRVDIIACDNIGPAGGFREGARKAYSDGYDLVIFADDDAYPAAPDMFRLFEEDAEAGHEAIAGCYADGNEIILANHYMALGRKAIRKAGFHFAPFFMIMEDGEYFRRIRNCSDVFHDRRIAIEHPFSIERSPKRGYYFMRNLFVLSSIRKDIRRAGIGSAIELSRTVFIAVFLGNRSFLLWYMRALKHFAEGRMGRDDRPEQALRVEEADPSTLGPKLIITDSYSFPGSREDKVIALGTERIGGKERVDLGKAFDILFRTRGRSMIVPKRMNYLAYPPFSILAKDAYVYDDRTGKACLLHRNNAILSTMFMIAIVPALAASAISVSAMAWLLSPRYDKLLRKQLEEDKAYCMEIDGKKRPGRNRSGGKR